MFIALELRLPGLSRSTNVNMALSAIRDTIAHWERDGSDQQGVENRGFSNCEKKSGNEHQPKCSLGITYLSVLDSRQRVFQGEHFRFNEFVRLK